MYRLDYQTYIIIILQMLLALKNNRHDNFYPELLVFGYNNFNIVIVELRNTLDGNVFSGVTREFGL
jgi:hypothetical protein